DEISNNIEQLSDKAEIAECLLSMGGENTWKLMDVIAEFGKARDFIEAVNMGLVVRSYEWKGDRVNAQHLIKESDFFKEVPEDELGQELKGFLIDYYRQIRDGIDDNGINNIESAIAPERSHEILELIKLASYLGETPEVRSEIFSKFYTGDHGTGSSIYYSVNYENVIKAIDLDKLSGDDKKFWGAIDAMGGHMGLYSSNIGEHYVLSSLINNRNKFSSYVDFIGEEGKTPQLTTEFLMDGLGSIANLPKGSYRHGESLDFQFLETYFEQLEYDYLPNLEMYGHIFHGFRKTHSHNEIEQARLGVDFLTLHGRDFINDGEFDWSKFTNFSIRADYGLESKVKLLDNTFKTYYSAEKNILNSLPSVDKQFWSRWMDLADNERLMVLRLMPQEGVVTPEYLSTIDFVAQIPEKCKWMVDEKMGLVKDYVYMYAQEFLRNSDDLSFINSIIGISGQKSLDMLESYKLCIDIDVINESDRGIFLDFIKQFKTVSPKLIEGYKEARIKGYEGIFIADLKSIAGKMTGAGEITPSDREKPYFIDLIKHVYPNNSGVWGKEAREGLKDRSADLDGLKIEPKYRIDLLNQSAISLKEGETIDPEVLKSLQDPIYAVSRKLQESGMSTDKLRQNLVEDINRRIMLATENGAFDGLDVSRITTEQKMFLLISHAVYSGGNIDRQDLSELMVTYQFTHFDDVENFIRGTQDRVSGAENQDYALLCELSQFYSDNIKDVNKKLIESGFGDDTIAEYMKTYFHNLSQDEQIAGKRDKVNRLQIGKLGMSPGFIVQVGKILEQRQGRKLTTEDVQKIITRYETIAGGLTERSSTSKNKQTQALYGTLRTQREKTFEALKLIAGADIDPKTVHLGEINLQQALDAEEQILEGVYSPDQFASYTSQRFLDIFEDQRDLIDLNLAKFVSESGKQRQILNGYITKISESAYARRVGGVCVSIDDNLWEMPNYSQLVFQDPESLQCQGLVLMHHFTDGGKRVLTASFNPSSTYLYTVDEEACFKGIEQVLEKFARDNNFDLIAVSKNRAIRTNRTGGNFEKAMNSQIEQVGKEFSFSKEQVFSTRPEYVLKDMDVLWENNSQN
ncbi:MAG TPA: hypothetical protein VG917_05945, partial [Patescibacteria group bacterium]|nr:hypothetical protein [Patescibacteria group bacterium]